jgi:Flp pilus assembly pilin Flp
MLSNITAALARFVARLENYEGQALAEYALIIGLVAIALVVALGALALAIVGSFDAFIAGLP